MPVPKGVRYGGRQKGTPNKRTLDLRWQALEHGKDAFARITQLVKSADERVALSAAQTVLDRAYGKTLMSRTVEVEGLPVKLNTPGAVRKALEVIIRAATNGTLTTAEAIDLCRLLELERKIATMLGEVPVPPDAEQQGAVVDFDAYRQMLREVTEDE